jgi:hypothetical protein
MKANDINSDHIFSVIKVILVAAVLLMLLLLSGCSKNEVVTNYYQSNYGEQCLYEPHTNSYKNLLFCYQENLSKEHSQNKLTNQ